MSAAVLAALAEVDTVCAHAEARARQKFIVPRRRGRRVELCGPCHRAFKAMFREWDAGTIGPAEVARRTMALGFSRFDAASLVFGLISRRLGAKIGLVREAA